MRRHLGCWGLLLAWSALAGATGFQSGTIVDSQWVVERPRGRIYLAGGVLLEAGTREERRHAVYLVALVKWSGEGAERSLRLWDARSGREIPLGGAGLPQPWRVAVRDYPGYTGFVLPLRIDGPSLERDVYLTCEEGGRRHFSPVVQLKVSAGKVPVRDTPRAWPAPPAEEPNLLAAFPSSEAGGRPLAVRGVHLISYSSAPGPDDPAAFAFGMDVYVRVDASLLPLDVSRLDVIDAMNPKGEGVIVEAAREMPSENGSARVFRLRRVLVGKPDRVKARLYVKLDVPDGSPVYSNEGEPDRFFEVDYDLATAVHACPVAVTTAPDPDRAFWMRPLIGSDVGIRLEGR